MFRKLLQDLELISANSLENLKGILMFSGLNAPQETAISFAGLIEEKIKLWKVSGIRQQ